MLAADHLDKHALADPLMDILIMKPKPSPYPLVRIGGDQDGAYLIPDDLQGIRACFSPGVNNTKKFEDDLTTNHGIACHLCDFTSDIEAMETPLIEGMQTFIKKWLDVDHGVDNITLDEWVEDQCAGDQDDLLLQMDIEGAEYRNLLTCSQRTLKRFRIIAIELHKLASVNDPEEFELELGPLLRRLDQTHVCVHAHPNNCCGEFVVNGSSLVLPNIIELTFLSRSRFDQGQASKLYPPLLPHPMDIDFNVTELPPLLLEGEWVDESSNELESPAGLRNWKKTSLLSKRLAFAYRKIESLSQKQIEFEHSQAAAKCRIDQLEKRLGELDRPIQLYLRAKRLLKRMSGDRAD